MSRLKAVANSTAEFSSTGTSPVQRLHFATLRGYLVSMIRIQFCSGRQRIGRRGAERLRALLSDHAAPFAHGTESLRAVFTDFRRFDFGGAARFRRLTAGQVTRLGAGKLARASRAIWDQGVTFLRQLPGRASPSPLLSAAFRAPDGCSFAAPRVAAGSLGNECNNGCNLTARAGSA